MDHFWIFDGAEIRDFWDILGPFWTVLVSGNAVILRRFRDDFRDIFRSNS